MSLKLQFTDPESPIYDGTDIYRARGHFFSGAKNGDTTPTPFNWLMNLTPGEVAVAISTGIIPADCLCRAVSDRSDYLDKYDERLVGFGWTNEQVIEPSSFPVLLSLLSNNGSTALASGRLSVISDPVSRHILQDEGDFVCLGDLPSNETEVKEFMESLSSNDARANAVMYVGRTEAGKRLLRHTYSLSMGSLALSLERLSIHAVQTRVAQIAMVAFMHSLVMDAPKNVSEIVGYVTTNGAAHQLLGALFDLDKVRLGTLDYPWDVAPMTSYGEVLTMDAIFGKKDGRITESPLSRTLLFGMDLKKVRYVVNNINPADTSNQVFAFKRVLDMSSKLAEKAR